MKLVKVLCCMFCTLFWPDLAQNTMLSCLLRTDELANRNVYVTCWLQKTVQGRGPSMQHKSWHLCFPLIFTGLHNQSSVLAML